MCQNQCHRHRTSVEHTARQFRVRLLLFYAVTTDPTFYFDGARIGEIKVPRRTTRSLGGHSLMHPLTFTNKRTFHSFTSPCTFQKSNSKSLLRIWMSPSKPHN